MNTSRNSGFISPREQRLIANACVAIAGVGGDGGQVAEVLVRLGFSRFRLADPEAFEEENLNRQNGCNTQTLGRNKAEVIGEMLTLVNPAAQVEIFPDGVHPENVDEFVEGADLVIDETEYTHPELAVMLARAARGNGLPVLTGLNVGFGCIVTSFMPRGMSLERYLGIPEDLSLPEVAVRDIPLGRWVPRLPSYAHEGAFRAVSAGEVPTPSVAPGVSLAAAVVSTEAINHVTGRRKPVSAPRSLHVDAMERRSRLVRFPALSFAASLARMVVRSRMGRNEATLMVDPAESA